MGRYRFSSQAESDIVGVLGWSQERFGVDARKRYEALLAAAFRDVASQPGGIGSTPRTELGPGISSWHLRLSRSHVPAGVGTVHRPRHFVLYRQVDDVVEIVRVLHDAMELSRHLATDEPTG